MFADRTGWNLEENALSRALARHRAVGRPFLDLTVSNPTRCSFQYDKTAVLGALANPAALDYDPQPIGILPAREAVAEYYASHHTAVSPDDVLLTTGTSEGYSFLFRLLCNSGDEVLIPAPGYPLFDFLADIHDVRLVRYPLLYDHGWQIDLHELQRGITDRTRAVIVIHPNNPTGQFVSAAERAELTKICAREVALIADEVFLDFAVSGAPPFSFSGNRDALTFTLSGLSKICGLPQMKLAWIAASGSQAQKSAALARLEVISDAYLSVGAPVQLAAPKLLSQRAGFQQQVLARLRANLATLDAALPPGSAVSRLPVDAGWTVILRAPATQPDEAAAVRLLEQHEILVQPGHFYGMPGDGYFVLSLLVPPPQFAEGVHRFCSAF